MGHIVNAEDRHLPRASSHLLLTFILLLAGSKSVISALEGAVQGRRVLFCCDSVMTWWGGGAEDIGVCVCVRVCVSAPDSTY